MRKRCTRQHFIEYLGYNYVEKQCLLARCTWQRYVHDFGKDGFITTYALNGELEKGQIDVQVKATDHIKRYKKDGGYFFDIEARDLEAWFNEFIPFILVLYDAQNDTGFFLEISEYFKEGGHFSGKTRKFVRVYIPLSNIFNPDAVITLRQTKNNFHEVI